MADPPRSQTDEWAARIRKAQADVATYPQRQRRITDELALQSRGWKNIPLTVGMLIAIVYGFIWVASEIRGYYADMDGRMERAIMQHDKDSTCHQHIDADHRAAIAHIHQKLSKMQDTLEVLKDKHRVTRRRR